MLAASRLLKNAILSVVTIGAVACSNDSVTGATPRHAALDVGTPVYAQDFSSGVGSEWSDTTLSVAPNGEKFFGEFGNQDVSLNLAGLAAHDSITISLDFYAIRSWDGTDATWGTDAFRITADGNTLLNSTFANTEGTQNYPSALGGGTAPALTGAAAVNSLGYTYWAGEPVDATYHFTFTIAHTAGTLHLSLSALGLQDISDESWGVDNIVVSIK